MTEPRGHRLGDGLLSAGRVVDDALAMLRQNLLRISAASLIFFALPAVIVTVAEVAIEAFTPEHGLPAAIAVFTTVVTAFSLSLLGPIAFAGFLDEAVAEEYADGHRRTLRDVRQSLPWVRLITADIVVVALIAITLELFVVPGLVVYGGLGLIGPVIVRERDGVLASMRRTVALASTAPVLVAVLVVAPFVVEQVVDQVLHHTLESAGFGAQLFAEWVVAVTLGGTVGLIEVALALQLMVRNPRPNGRHADS